MSVIFKEDQLKSIIRIIERFLKRVKWSELEDKKKIFVCVLERSDIDVHIKQHMISNAMGADTEEDFYRYLRNSKAYYENKQRMLVRFQKTREKRMKPQRLLKVSD